MARNAILSDLLERSANEDRAAFDRLHSLTYPLVFATVNKVLNNVPDTEEVCQEVFLSLWKKASKFSDQRGTPVSWIATMARNRAIDRIRAKTRRSKLYADYESQPEIQRVGYTKRPTEHVTRQEEGAVVRNAVMRLKPDQRRAVELAYFKGLTQKQVAKQLNEPVGTVKSWIRRGMEGLRSDLKEQLSMPAA